MLSDQFPALIERDDVKTLAVHDLALTEIQAMFDATNRVAATHGKTSDEYLNMVTSLNQCLGSLFRVGFGSKSYITRDGNLSLFVQDGDSFVFGMIFHPDHKWDNPPEGYVQPGTWTLHS
jgi:hypothetical protein